MGSVFVEASDEGNFKHPLVKEWKPPFGKKERGPNILAVGIFLPTLILLANEGFPALVECQLVMPMVVGLIWSGSALGNVASGIVSLSNSYPRVMMLLLVLDLSVNMSFTPPLVMPPIRASMVDHR
ncbi:hypothetical protein Tco_1303937 [Tanacetum coccineum]